ncbi:helix-turn-helix domain-containing protein [Halomarina salina]|uniref:Helix-turn-helix domain-containing protein n=1 Tax=Halomarina salina TaxID=1872699 RepID=A0ABD5RIQ2_9EURY|nr:helix-turn-helix domain-containing protein [Halomarina salina]
MGTVATLAIPAEEFALWETLDAVPDASFECERIVESGENVMPLLWARAPDGDALERALLADSSANDVSLLSAFDDEWLYRMEWVDHIQLITHMLTNSHATILSAVTEDSRWVVRILFPDHDSLATANEFCHDHGLTFDLLSIVKMEGDPSARYGLTGAQYDAIVTAHEHGYFAVPRRCSLKEIAREEGISHQAFSERLRRGLEALVEETLVVGQSSEVAPTARR